MDGEEVVQLYIKRKNQSADGPIRSLKGFARVSLKAGEQKTHKFLLSAEDLTFVDAKGTSLPLTGEIEISIGGSQPDETAPTTGNVLKRSIQIR